MPATPRTIRDECPHCSTRYHLPETAIGQRARCKKCDAEFTIGALPEALASELAEKFDPIRYLDAGGMGRVFFARDRVLEQDRAIKVISPNRSGSRNALNRFKAEIKTLAILCDHPHPNVVRFYFYGVRQGYFYYVMAYLPGIAYGDLVIDDAHAIGITEVRHVGAQIGAALGHMHRLGVIHRDVKPGNIVRRHADGEPVLIDFGLAKPIGDLAAMLTGDGVGLGTVAFMPYEQKYDAKRVDHRADQYSLAATLYALATGTLPDPPDFELVTDPLLRAVLTRAMKRAPDDRFPNMDAFVAALTGPATSSPLPPPPSAKSARRRPPRAARPESSRRVRARAESERRRPPRPLEQPATDRERRELGARIKKAQEQARQKAHSKREKDKARALVNAEPRELAVYKGSLMRKGHAGPIVALAVTAGEPPLLVTGSTDKTARTWELDSGRPLQVLRDHKFAVGAVAALSDGRGATGSVDTSIKLWDLAAGVAERTLAAHGWAVTALTPAGDDRLLSASGDRTARLWDTRTGDCLITLAGHKSGVTALAVTPDGRLAATGTKDGQLSIWILRDGTRLTELKGLSDDVLALALTPEGRRVLSVTRAAGVCVWGIPERRALATLIGPDDRPTSLALSHGRLVACGTADGRVLLVDIAASERLGELRPGSCAVRAVIFGPEHEGSLTLIAAGEDGTARRLALGRLWSTDAESSTAPV